MSDTNLSSLANINGGYETTRFNALRHGVLSRYTVLPWEDEAEYQTLLSALADEHAPQGPTEEHLVEELAGVLWRKRRLRLAEAAAYRHGLDDATESYRSTVKVALVHLDAGQQIERVVDAVQATAEQTSQAIRDLDEDEEMTAEALKLLRGCNPNSYELAIDVLRADTCEWWQYALERGPDEIGEGETPTKPNAVDLQNFIENELLPWYAQRRKELENRPLIREQAFGEAFDPDKLGQLARYEVHLDRKLERTLAMLFRLKDIRRETADG